MDSNTQIQQLWLKKHKMLAICAVFLFVHITLYKCATIITSTSMFNTNDMNSLCDKSTKTYGVGLLHTQTTAHKEMFAFNSVFIVSFSKLLTVLYCKAIVHSSAILTAGFLTMRLCVSLLYIVSKVTLPPPEAKIETYLLL